MMFFRENEYMVSCTIDENEILQMGYQMSDILLNKELAKEFFKEICEKAFEMGVEIAEHIETIQIAATHNKQFILTFMEENPDEQINETIQNLLDVAEVVEFLGKERLENIFNLTGAEKIEEFQNCLYNLQQSNKEDHDPFEQTGDSLLTDRKRSLPVGQGNLPVDQRYYFIYFDQIQEVISFSKRVQESIPGRLYKFQTKYILFVDIDDMEQEERKNFQNLIDLSGQEYRKDIGFVVLLEEHGEILIKGDAIARLKNI